MRATHKYTIVTIVIFFVLLLQASAQTASGVNKTGRYKDPQGCIYKPVYSALQRRQFYPFKNVDTIQLVSFRYYKNHYPVANSTVLYDSLIQVKTLNRAETDSLTDILYNNFYNRKPPCCIGSVTQCFFPRNAIVFIKNGRVKEYALLCFHCNNFETSSANIVLGESCAGKMEKLRQFFISSGIDFGTNRDIDLYPGEISDDAVAPPVDNQ